MKKELFIEEILFRAERKLHADGSYKNVLRGAHGRYLVVITDDGGNEYISLGQPMSITTMVNDRQVAIGEARPHNPSVVTGVPLTQILSDLHILQQSTIDSLTQEAAILNTENKKLAEAIAQAALLLKKFGYELKG
jgi:hypothetical protein